MADGLCRHVAVVAFAFYHVLRTDCLQVFPALGLDLQAMLEKKGRGSLDGFMPRPRCLKAMLKAARPAQCPMARRLAARKARLQRSETRAAALELIAAKKRALQEEGVIWAD